MTGLEGVICNVLWIIDTCTYILAVTTIRKFCTLYFSFNVYPLPSSCEQDHPVIHVYDGRGENKEIAILDNLHSSPITFMEVHTDITSHCALISLH